MRRAFHAYSAAAQQEAVVHHVHESKTGSWQYIVADPSTSRAIIIDPVLDYDAATAKITIQTADSLLSLVEEKSYTVQMILETYAHADHLTAADNLRQKLAKSQGHTPPVGIGKRIVDVQNSGPTDIVYQQRSITTFSKSFSKMTRPLVLGL